MKGDKCSIHVICLQMTSLLFYEEIVDVWQKQKEAGQENRQAFTMSHTMLLQVREKMLHLPKPTFLVPKYAGKFGTTEMAGECFLSSNLGKYHCQIVDMRCWRTWWPSILSDTPTSSFHVPMGPLIRRVHAHLGKCV